MVQISSLVDHLGWLCSSQHTEEDGTRIVFSDKSWFVLRPTDNRARSSAEIPWEQFKLETYRGGSVMVWEPMRRKITVWAFTTMVRILRRATLDNAPSHRCTLMNQIKSSTSLGFGESTGHQEVDLNPIKHFWDLFGCWVTPATLLSQTSHNWALSLKNDFKIRFSSFVKSELLCNIHSPTVFSFSSFYFFMHNRMKTMNRLINWWIIGWISSIIE